MKNLHLLEEELQNELKELSKLQVGSKEYETAVEGITKLISKINEMERTQKEFKDKIEARENENYWKSKEMKSERNHKIIGHLISIVGITVPAVITIWGTKVSLNFEKEGIVSTIIGRGFINKLLPRK